MGEVRKAVGVYERPEKRSGVRTAFITGAVAIAALATAAVLLFYRRDGFSLPGLHILYKDARTPLFTRLGRRRPVTSKARETGLFFA